MKVLAINGSARKNGNTDILIGRIFEKLHAAGIETEAVQFAGNTIQPCRACFACGGKENCHGDGNRCMTHELWAALNEKMVDFLDSVSLQKLVDDQLAKGLVVESAPLIKRAISSNPVLKPIRINAPNSVFALGASMSKS